MDVTFDTSALSDMLREDSDFAFLQGALGKGRLRLLVPSTTLFEVLLGESLYQLKRQQRLGLLASQYPDQLLFSCEHNHLFQRELRRNGRLDRIPLLAPEKRATLRQVLSGSIPISQSPEFSMMSLEAYRRTQAMLMEAAQSTRDKFKRDGVPSAQIIKTIDNFSGLNVANRDFIETMFQIHDGVIYGLSRNKLKKVIASSGKYKGFKTYLSFWFIRLYLDALYEPTGELAKLSKIDQGNVPDVSIAACAGYTTHLVTEDKRFRAICEKLFAKRVIQFEATSIEGFKNLSLA